MVKTLYLDVETTGLIPDLNGIIQLACIIDIDGKEQAHFIRDIKPFPGDTIEDDALKVNGKTREDLQGFEDPRTAYRDLIEFLDTHVDKFDRADKYYPAGYNVDFDMKMLKAFFVKNGDVYFGSWFNGRNIDLLPWLNMLRWNGKLSLPNHKLTTVCAHFGVDLGESAHDAMADIRATRELIQRLADREAQEAAIVDFLKATLRPDFHEKIDRLPEGKDEIEVNVGFVKRLYELIESVNSRRGNISDEHRQQEKVGGGVHQKEK